MSVPAPPRIFGYGPEFFQFDAPGAGTGVPPTQTMANGNVTIQPRTVPLTGVPTGTGAILANPTNVNYGGTPYMAPGRTGLPVQYRAPVTAVPAVPTATPVGPVPYATPAVNPGQTPAQAGAVATNTVRTRGARIFGVANILHTVYQAGSAYSDWVGDTINEAADSVDYSEGSFRAFQLRQAALGVGVRPVITNFVGNATESYLTAVGGLGAVGTDPTRTSANPFGGSFGYVITSVSQGSQPYNIYSLGADVVSGNVNLADYLGLSRPPMMTPTPRPQETMISPVGFVVTPQVTPDPGSRLIQEWAAQNPPLPTAGPWWQVMRASQNWVPMSR